MVRLVGAVLGGLVASAAIVFIVGMRRKSPVVLGAIRRMNRALINPRQLLTAGQPGAAASKVHHRGRRSGRAYETPVGAIPIPGGFVIALPYGTQADWLRNVLAAGEATIVHEGSTYAVTAPELVPVTELNDHFTAADRRGFRLLATEHALRLRHDNAAAAPTT